MCIHAHRQINIFSRIHYQSFKIFAVQDYIRVKYERRKKEKQEESGTKKKGEKGKARVRSYQIEVKV